MNTFNIDTQVRYADCHIHSCHSFDAAKNATVENICEAAIAKGLRFIAITDHLDLNNYYTKKFLPVYDVQKAYDDVTGKIGKYQDRIKVSYGIELGQAHDLPDDARAYLEKYKPETVVGSLHNTRGDEDNSTIDYTDYTDEEIEASWYKYLDEMLEISDFPDIDIIAHLTYPIRYIIRAERNLDVKKTYPVIEKLLKKIIAKNLCLEFNTSTFYREKYGYKRYETEKDIFSIYRDCGGRLVTLGSDAHNPGHIAGAFDEVCDILKKIGFNEAMYVYKGNIEAYKI